MKKLGILLVTAFALTACGHDSSDRGDSDTPYWVQKTFAFDDGTVAHCVLDNYRNQAISCDWSSAKP